ncbi:hypothetical protein Tco_0211856 [Tanacetum coccineum]
MEPGTSRGSNTLVVLSSSSVVLRISGNQPLYFVNWGYDGVFSNLSLVQRLKNKIMVQFRRTSLTGFPAQSIRSSNAIALDSPYLLVLITGTSQSRQHESRKSPTKSLFDVGSRRISIVTVNTKENHSIVLAIITRIMRRTC